MGLMLRKFIFTTLLVASSAWLKPSAFSRQFATQLKAGTPRDQLPQSDAGWRAVLSPDQFAVLRQQATGM